MKTCVPQEIVDQMKVSLKKKEISTNVIAEMLPEEKMALKAILENVVSTKLGIKVSSAEVGQITKLAKEIDTAQTKLGTDLGNPSKLKENLDFFKAKKQMDDYLLSRSPSNKLKVLTGTIGRGMMLASVKSPILNIGSNIEVGFTEALARRLNNFSLRGADNELAVSYVKMVNKIYQETGFDVSRMTTLRDTGAGGARILGEMTHSQGPGGVRKVGRVVEDVVFKQLMGAPDVAFSSAHFADSVNLNALKIAKGDKELAKKIMVDSMRLEPITPEGDIVRAQGILDATKATWTDTSWASRVSEGIRKILNDVSGDVRVGDYVLPFVKTPANVIATGMDYAGMGIPKALVKTVKAFKAGNLGSKEYFQSITRDLIRSGLGLVGAVAIVSQLKKDDFIGAYDPARAQIETLKNSNYNAIRVGGKWISTDWLGPLAVPVTAMMYAKKYGDTPGERTFQYSKGVLASALNIPGVSDIYDLVKTNAYKKNTSLEEMTSETANYITSEAYSRLIPSFLSDLSKAIDPNVRNTKGTTFGFIPNALINKVPGLSTTLPEKQNVFGETIKGEPAISDILFGSRVKTDKETPLLKEITRVTDANGKSISFTDWDKSSSKTLAQFRNKVGETKFNEAKVKYGQELKKQLELTINKQAYKNLSDEEKLKVLNGKDTDAMNKIFLQYGFKYKSTPTKKIPDNI